MLFGVVEKKDATGTTADISSNPVVLCLKTLRKSCPDLMLLADVCLCEYTDHGHCAPLKHVHGEGELIDNDAGVSRLANVALTYVGRQRREREGYNFFKSFHFIDVSLLVSLQYPFPYSLAVTQKQEHTWYVPQT